MSLLTLTATEPDAKQAIELGLTLLLDKPMLVVAQTGVTVPASVRRAAVEVVEVDFADIKSYSDVIAAAIVRVREASTTPSTSHAREVSSDTTKRPSQK